MFYLFMFFFSFDVAGNIQEVILQERLEKEDEILVSLAGLKQVLLLHSLTSLCPSELLILSPFFLLCYSFYILLFCLLVAVLLVHQTLWCIFICNNKTQL